MIGPRSPPQEALELLNSIERRVRELRDSTSEYEEDLCQIEHVLRDIRSLLRPLE